MKKFIFAVLALGFASTALANDAGCGLGSMVIQQNTKLMQVFAATTNGTFGSQTFGITSGTSNCKASNFVMNQKEIQYFAEVNQNDLTKEMAQGSGEKLNVLAALYGCAAERKAEFSKMTQKSYGHIVTSEKMSSVEFVKNLDSAVAQSKICSNI